MATTKKANVFDIVKRIMTTKDNWEDIPEDERSTWNSWMVNKILSMNPNYCEVVNIIQKNTWTLKPEYLYKVYVDIIPKGYIFSKYIKNNSKKEYKLEQVNAMKWICSRNKNVTFNYYDIEIPQKIDKLDGKDYVLDYIKYGNSVPV